MNAPRILPLIAVAIAGVLGLKLVTGAPELFSGAKAWAEEIAPEAEGDKAAGKAAKDSKAASAMPADASLAPAPKPMLQACAPTAAELARQAGLSPAELQVLQSLGVRRNELDAREKGMEVQLALLAAAEAKLDAKLKALGGLKGEITDLLSQADSQRQAEMDRLVKVFETMKPKDAAARMVILDDGVRLPIGAKMKDRALSAIIAQMPPGDAKEFTEKLANRMAAAEAAKAALTAQAAPAAAAPAPAKAVAKPAAPRPAAAKTAAPKPAPAPAAAPAPAKAAAAPPPATPPVTPPATAG